MRCENAMDLEHGLLGDCKIMIDSLLGSQLRAGQFDERQLSSDQTARGKRHSVVLHV